MVFSLARKLNLFKDKNPCLVESGYIHNSRTPIGVAGYRAGIFVFVM
jgi:hypothetical protein